MIEIDLTEAQFQSIVTRHAEELGWDWLHIATTGIGRHSPMRGTLGVGWPDLTMCRGTRMIAAEVKTEKGVLTLKQKYVLGVLALAGMETYVWRPSDIPRIVAELARR